MEEVKEDREEQKKRNKGMRREGQKAGPREKRGQRSKCSSAILAYVL
jgi:hypothetical protein